MSGSIRDIPKKRGRPSTGGRGTGVLVRLSDEGVDLIDAYRAELKSTTGTEFSRPEAIRNIIGEHFKVKPRKLV